MNATENATDKPSPAAKPSSALSIALAWLVVVVPAAWGVYNTALKAANLFK
jgi:hypothetical protein